MELTVTMGASGGEPGSVGRRRRGDGEQLPIRSEWECVGRRVWEWVGLWKCGGAACGAMDEWERGAAGELAWDCERRRCVVEWRGASGCGETIAITKQDKRFRQIEGVADVFSVLET
jgi:hypothetical protein